MQNEKVEDLELQLEKEKLESKTMKRNYDTDKHMWAIEKEKLMTKIHEVCVYCNS